MEKLTNSRREYWQALRNELSNFEPGDDWQTLCNYTEISQLLIYAYSVNIEIDKVGESIRLNLKKLKTPLANSNQVPSIYNLSRIPIVEQYINADNWRYLIKTPAPFSEFGIVENEGIVLDGLYCCFEDPKEQKRFLWNIDAEMNEPLARFIEKIRVQIYAQLS